MIANVKEIKKKKRRYHFQRLGLLFEISFDSRDLGCKLIEY